MARLTCASGGGRIACGSRRSPTRGALMAVAFILDFDNGDPQKYEQVVEKMGLGGRVAPGALFHAAGPGPDGGWRVCDVWESDDAFNAFAAEKIIPITQEAGLNAPAITRFEVAETIDSGALRDGIEFVQVVRFPSMDAATFDAMDKEITAPGLPGEITYHVNGGVDGDWVVIDAWTSKEARDRFMQNQVFPVAAKHPEIAPPEIHEMQVHNTLEPVG